MPAHPIRHIKPANLYLVRLWAQDLEDKDGASAGNADWQGRVQRVIDGESRHFDDLQDLVDVLLQMLSGKSE